MSEEDKRTVTDKPDAGNDAQTEGADAQDDLDSILSEYEQNAESKETKAEQPKKTDEDDEVRQWARQRMEEDNRQKIKDALNESVKELKGDSEIDDDLAEGYLRKRAADDPRIEKAFYERAKNPSAWKSVLKGLQKDFQSKFSDVDRSISDDMGAARAAVRSASTKPPQDDFDPKKVVEMDPKEFAQYVERLQRSG